MLSWTQFIAVQKAPMETVASLGKENEPGTQFPEM